MSPFFVKIVFTVCTLVILCPLFIILSNIYSIKEESETEFGQLNGRLRQHGDYWVWHEYIRSAKRFKDNQSITLTTHATYMDLVLLPNLLYRWQAPISLAIYACGEDFERTIDSLKYINSCLKLDALMRRFVSIHLVFHNRHLPKDLDMADATVSVDPDACQQPPYEKLWQNLTYWYEQKLDYPVNLLRNVARSNAFTYYILALDMQLLPSTNFAKRFLDAFWSSRSDDTDIILPYRTIFCLPTFAPKIDDPLAGSKPQLQKIPEPLFKDIDLQSQRLSSMSLSAKISILGISKKMDTCAGYVSINELEPLYDERCPMESIYELGNNLKGKVLISLNYTFVTLKGAYLTKTTLDSWSRLKRVKITQKNNLKLWLTWHQFYNNFVNLHIVQTDETLNQRYLRISEQMNYKF